MNVAQWQPTPHRQTVTPLPWCVLLFPYLDAIPPEIKMAIQILPLSLGCDRSLSTIFDTHCNVTDISQFSFSRMKIRRVAIELGHVREHMRGEEIDTRECPALNPLFLLCWLFSAKIGKTCYTQERAHTHTHIHTDVHTYPGAWGRILCPSSVYQCPSLTALCQARHEGACGYQSEWLLLSGCFSIEQHLMSQSLRRQRHRCYGNTYICALKTPGKTFQRRSFKMIWTLTDKEEGEAYCRPYVYVWGLSGCPSSWHVV